MEQTLMTEELDKHFVNVEPTLADLAEKQLADLAEEQKQPPRDITWRGDRL